MISNMRNTVPKAITFQRSISSSARSNSIATPYMSSHTTQGSSSRAAKVAGYAVLGSAVAATGASILLKDEVVYWTPNSRK
ncbi:hypothetical protein BGZ76_002764 [Entomortierella beljakovae]|nr:hypothetical protein BGZ76_002764 [Entomortierella beljakovae]